MIKVAYAYKNDGTSMSFNLEEKNKIDGKGEGTVYKIGTISGFNGNFCAKIYHQKYRTQDRQNKVSFMTQNKPSVLSSDLVLICWPLLLLYDKPANGNFVGFVMYHAFEGSSTMEELAMIVTQESFNNRLSVMSKTDKEIFVKFPRCWESSSGDYSEEEIKLLLNRFKVIANIATIFNYLHSTQKYVVIDIKPANLLLTAKAGVSLVDVDSIQIWENGKLLPTDVGTPGYLPPEHYVQQNLGTSPISVSYDLFALAVLFYEILIGVHPFSCRPLGGKDYDIERSIKEGCFRHGKNKAILISNNPAHFLFDYLPSSIQTLFIQAFENMPNSRPRAREWFDELKKIIVDLERGNNTLPKPINSVFQETKHCTQCGKQYNKPTLKYCSYCGHKRK